MSSEWPVVTVDEVCELIVDCVNKTAPVVDYATPHRMIRTTNIREGRISLENCRCVDEDTYQKWTRRAKLQYGDVLLTREAPIGEVGFVDMPEGLFLGQRIMQYRADKKVLHPRFLLYSFLSPSLQHQFGSHEGSGSVVSHIRVGDCFKFKISLPPLDVQTGIAELLGAIDDRITLLRKTNATLEAIAQGLFKSWFVDFDPVRYKAEGLEPEGVDASILSLFPDTLEESFQGMVPTGWSYAKLGDVCDYLSRGISPKYVEEGGVLVINQKCIRNCSVDYVKARRHDPLQRKIDGRTLKVGDVLVNSTGVGTLGRVAQILALPGLAIVDSHVTVVRAGSSVSWNYLGQWMVRKQPEIETMGEGSTGQTELARSKLSELSILIPAASVLAAFDELVFPLNNSIALNENRVSSLLILRDTLLPRLISGQIRLPEAKASINRALSESILNGS